MMRAMLNVAAHYATQEAYHAALQGALVATLRFFDAPLDARRAALEAGLRAMRARAEQQQHEVREAEEQQEPAVEQPLPQPPVQQDGQPAVQEVEVEVHQEPAVEQPLPQPAVQQDGQADGNVARARAPSPPPVPGPPTPPARAQPRGRGGLQRVGRPRGRPRIHTGNTPPRPRNPVGRPPGPARRVRHARPAALAGARGGAPAHPRGAGRGVPGIQPIDNVIVLDDDGADIFQVPDDDWDFQAHVQEVNNPAPAAVVAEPPAAVVAEPRQQPPVPPPGPPAPAQAQGRGVCSLCMEGEATCLVVPCHHMCLCEDCAELWPFEMDSCPNCGTLITEQPTRVYLNQ
ncbi:putative E3 ubiquitin-protein ligase LUL3 [Frankliniella fusca]|uniref:E3 ubiquitin-protein ligase LUL3 n=1 Tax=Frankliniella fusca TaxID=407009 RepID=A0AAE1HBF3_9NEOP|nr:putative E3 ubiquitin-protein ligase LUL3 [Frankliniella fusca]